MARPGALLTALMLLLGTGSLSSAQRGWDLGKQTLRFSIPVRDYEICIVKQTGWMNCISKREVGERLKTQLTVRESRLVIGAIDEINAGTGNSRESDILVHCMGDWHGAKAAAMPAPKAGPTDRTREASLPSGQMAQGRLNAVRSSCTSGSRAGTPAGDSAKWREAGGSLAAFEAAVEGCQGRVPSVADGSTDRSTWERKPRGSKESKGVSTLVNESRPSGGGQGQSGSAAQGGEDIGESLMNLVLETKAAEAEDRQSMEDGSVARLRADQFTAIEKARAAAVAERPAEEQLAGQCLVDGQCTETATSASMSLPPGEAGGSSCAAKAAWWNAFKDRCDRSNGRLWQCGAFTRLLDRCPDPTRINPGPNGDLTCLSPAARGAEVLRIADRCRKNRLIARTTPEGAFYCGQLPPVSMPRRGIDICRNDLTNPQPDQCPLDSRRTRQSDRQ